MESVVAERISYLVEEHDLLPKHHYGARCMEIQRQHGELIMQSNCTGSAERQRDQFPGLMSLVNSFQVAASRGTASKTPVILPPELQERILDFVNYDTWKTCLVVSREFRSYCLR